MSALYILVDGVPTPEPDPIKWADWFFNIENRRVARDTVAGHEVSTVFDGLHWFDNGDPVLYETRVTFPDGRIELHQYGQKAHATAAHKALVEKLTVAHFRGATLQ